MHTRLLRILILSIVTILIGVTIAYFQSSGETARVVNKGAKEIKGAIKIAGAQIGGPFSLVDHNGKSVTEADYAEKYKLIYFGFTYCPAICPTELQKISQVLNDMGPEQAEQIQPLFVTIDPERDTPAVMKDYVSLFRSDLVGLSGSQAQIDKVLGDYKIFAKKVWEDDKSDYTMDHSSYIYFLTPDNEMISIYRIRDTAVFMLKDIKSHLGSK